MRQSVKEIWNDEKVKTVLEGVFPVYGSYSKLCNFKIQKKLLHVKKDKNNLTEIFCRLILTGFI